MNLRILLQRADKQLAELHDEDGTRFDFSLNVIARAHELALEHNAAEAARVVENITGPLSPNAGRRLLAAMIAALPADESATMSVPQAAEILGVSKETVYRLCTDGILSHARVRNRITITPQQLEQYRREVER
jgi:excisionase family DNA binding protein